MKKYLFLINAKMYSFLCVFSVLNLGIHIGFHVGVYTQINRTPSPSFEYLIFVVAYLLFYWIARSLYMERECCSGKNCVVLALITLVSASLFWLLILNGNLNEIQEGLYEAHKWIDRWTIIVYPAVLLCVSLIICVNYTVCAVQIRKENKALGWKW